MNRQTFKIAYRLARRVMHHHDEARAYHLARDENGGQWMKGDDNAIGFRCYSNRVFLDEARLIMAARTKRTYKLMDIQATREANA